MYAQAESTVASLRTEKASDVRPAEVGPVNSQMPSIGSPPPSRAFTASFPIGRSRGAWTARGDKAAGIRGARLLSISCLNAALLDCTLIMFSLFVLLPNPEYSKSWDKSQTCTATGAAKLKGAKQDLGNIPSGSR
jgi:hypothetical protein